MAALGNPQPLRLSLADPGRQAGRLTVVLSGRVAPGDVADLDRRIATLLDEWLPRTLVCDVEALTGPDLATVDALARLRLTAGRHGCHLALRRVPAELHRLLELAGLGDVVPASAEGTLRQPEQREQARGVEKGVDPGDLAR